MSDLSIHPVYLSARAAIVAPERAIPLTIYATQKWLPRLGPERWCLVMLLRSLSIDSKRRNDGTKRVSCSWRQLSEMLDVHEETIASWLKHEPIPNDKPWRRIIPTDDQAECLALFIPRIRYAYETSSGKTRRVGFLLEVLMEDPVIPEDEIRLQKQIELMQLQQGTLGLETYRLTESVSPKLTELPQISKVSRIPEILDSRYVNPLQPGLHNEANPLQLDLHNQLVNSEYLDLPTNVKQDNSNSNGYVNQQKESLHSDKSAIPEKNVNELDILIQNIKQKSIRKNLRRDVFDPVIELTETLLDDTHSKGMLYKVLNSLYPERIDLYVAAVRVALDAARLDASANRGAIFVRAVKEFAEVAGVDLGLKRLPSDVLEDDGNPGSRQDAFMPSSLQVPSVLDAIWTETQLILRRQMTQATYDAIIQGTILLEQHGQKYVVGVRSEMAKEWLENRLREIVQRALSATIGQPVDVEFSLLAEVN